MKKRRLKGFVLPSLYLMITISVFVSIILLGDSLILSNDEYDYGINALQDNVESVIVEDTVTTSNISSPIEEGKAVIEIHYYDKESDENTQRNSLIYYENTYLPNTGVLYTSNEEFNIMNVFDGKVTEIIDDEFFTKCIVIEHENNLRTYYYGLDKINVKVGDELSNGQIIGISKKNNIMDTKNSFLFEVYHNSELINPESFIGTKITDYK